MIHVASCVAVPAHEVRQGPFRTSGRGKPCPAGRWRCLLGIPSLPAVTQVCSFRRNLAVATKSPLHLGAWSIAAHRRADLGGMMRA